MTTDKDAVEVRPARNRVNVPITRVTYESDDAPGWRVLWNPYGPGMFSVETTTEFGGPDWQEYTVIQREGFAGVGEASTIAEELLARAARGELPDDRGQEPVKSYEHEAECADCRAEWTEPYDETPCICPECGSINVTYRIRLTRGVT